MYVENTFSGYYKKCFHVVEFQFPEYTEAGAEKNKNVHSLYIVFLKERKKKKEKGKKKVIGLKSGPSI